jgi:uncharacterized protein YraI
MKRLAIGAAFALMAFPAAAQDAEVTADLNMRAGPATRYPIITTIPAGRNVEVYGCVSGYDWCDVSWRGFRGWVFTDYLEYYYRNDYRPVIEWGPRIGLPVISFTFGDYARRHYRSMPWYDDRWRWERRDRRDRDWRRDDDRSDWRDDDRYDRRDRNRDDDDNRYQNRVRNDDEDRGDETRVRRWRQDETQDDPGADFRRQQDESQADNRQRRMMRGDEMPGNSRNTRCNPAREDCIPGRSQSRGNSTTSDENNAGGNSPQEDQQED